MIVDEDRMVHIMVSKSEMRFVYEKESREEVFIYTWKLAEPTKKQDRRVKSKEEPSKSKELNPLQQQKKISSESPSIGTSFKMLRFIICLLASVIVVLLQSSVADGASSLAFFKRKTYTPLLFFKVPKGTMDECESIALVYTSRMISLFIIRIICT